MYKSILFFCFVLTQLLSQSVVMMDFVKVIDNNREEALYYYENNWAKLREIALKRNYIKSYKLLVSKTDSAKHFDIILYTEYPDTDTFDRSEENFREIINERKSKSIGIILLNHKKPAEFRKISANQSMLEHN